MISAKIGSQEAREAERESCLLYNGTDVELVRRRNSVPHRQHAAPAGWYAMLVTSNGNAVDPTAKERNVFLDRGGTDLPRTVIMEGETAFTSCRA
jgi:hypothetical protein